MSHHPARGHEETAAGFNPERPLRFISATSIFDGHDVSINIIRRLLQEQGAEVVHLGHNRGVDEIVRAALQEDADAIAISSYQGGHIEFFRYLLQCLEKEGASHIRVFGGGGGTITRDEIDTLVWHGVEAIYSPEDGRKLGLEGMALDMIDRTQRAQQPLEKPSDAGINNHQGLGRWLTTIELGRARTWPRSLKSAPVLGVTGTGGAGKSSVIDELLHQFLLTYPDLNIAVLAIDPTRHKSGGALLGDRIRLNSLRSERIYMRSMATRQKDHAINAILADAIDFLRHIGFGLVLVETAGTGQADLSVIELVDQSLYVMTSDYGAPSQLEKVQMLDYADYVALNKSDRRGSLDALRDLRKQWRRNHKAFDGADEELPIFGTTASYWNDAGVQQLFQAISSGLPTLPKPDQEGDKPIASAQESILIPPTRSQYLSEISQRGHTVQEEIEHQAKIAAEAQHHYQSLKALNDPQLPKPLDSYSQEQIEDSSDSTLQSLRQCYQQALEALSQEALALLRGWPQHKARIQAKKYSYQVRDQEFHGNNHQRSLSHLEIPKVAVPGFEQWGEQLRYLMAENLPGHYPFTAGVFPYRHADEDPTRMFAGEGSPERTNRRFHYLALGQKSKRLSTAFDPITLYGEDADPRPDIYGRIGMSGVSITSLDDMKKLYSGFDLCSPNTSVSMTINGPAPILLAWFLNTAVDQQIEIHLKAAGCWDEATRKIKKLYEDHTRPAYKGELPVGNDGLGLGMLGVTGDQLLDPETYAKIRSETLHSIRGTLQADILKEDQAQNECIFPLEFGLRLMGDIQEYFIQNQVRNYYSVSVSGYHIAEAGANPITQLAFTLANGFTLVEYYLARGMPIDEFAAQMSFFFSNGMDPEYAVIGRVARRIWARAMRDIYQANERSQKLKYHIQTSGRTLHAQTLGFNDIRTTLQALYALYDNCNSLHTNAYDEALTTPTEESVRRALAIQMIINQELGLNYNQNPMQGSYVIEQLTDQVEQAVYDEFDRLSERGGVLGAMETLYQRGKIQEESLYYEHQKHEANLPIVGVNCFVEKEQENPIPQDTQLIRSEEAEKQAQIEAVKLFKKNHQADADKALKELQRAAQTGDNSFEVLMESSKHCTLGQTTQALYEIVGRYRRKV